ncbi:MAG TPA: hypothetical protein VMM18_10680 [Gemmatimonadaceae bacterium]|nr:hypothetical protein [Gemmatimonadaceae bacterium]
MKQRTAVQREVGRLLDELAPERPPARHDAPVLAIKRHRAPGRCILQGESRAVSVSWFPARPDADTLGEVVVTEWRGEVSLPGHTRRSNAGAVAVETTLFRPMETSGGTWEWRSEGGAPAYGTDALAMYCRGLVE